MGRSFASDSSPPNQTSRNGCLPRWRFSSTLALCALALAGCGGSSDSAPTTLATFPDYLSASFVSSFDAFADLANSLITTDPRYTRQENTWWFPSAPSTRYTTSPLASSRANYAHAAGLTGAGSTIAFIDSGFLTTHEALAGRVTATASNLASDAHGTGVASVAAGNSASMIGIAPGANMVFGVYDSAESLAAGTRLASANRAVALNNSWNYVDANGQTMFATTANFNTFFATSADRAYLNALTNYAAEGVVVFAASNTETDTQSSLLSGLPLFRPELESGWLNVINADATWNDTAITSATRLSAACLETARWCLAAEGTWEAATNTSTTAYALETGTSLATPMVSGALALLQEAFPTLTPHQLRTRLLASADQSFAEFTADGSFELAPTFSRNFSTEWGMGFLDIRAALLPIGTTTVPLSATVNHTLAQPLLLAGAASGDAIAHSLARTDVLAVDTLGGDFRLPGTALVAEPLHRSATDRLNMAVLEASRFALLSEYAVPSVAQLSPDTRLALLAPSGTTGTGPLGLSVQTDLGATTLGLTLAKDDGLLLPSSSTQPGSLIATLDVSHTAPLSANTDLRFGLSWGVAQSTSTGVAALHGLAVNSLKLAALRHDIWHEGDSLGFSVALPMALISGATTLTLPTGRDASGSPSYTAVAVDLTPRQREIDLALSYRGTLGARTEGYFGVLHALNSGNIAGLTDTGLATGLRITF